MGVVDVIIASYSFSTTTIAFVLEAIRIYQETERLQIRNAAYVRGQLQSYDAQFYSSLYVPSTDVPLHPAAIGLTPLYRIVTCVVLFFLMLDQLPGQRFTTEYLGNYILTFNKDVSIWYSGFMQFYIALSVLGTPVVFPTGPDIGLNDNTVLWARYANGWLLLIAGVVNIGIGLVFGPAIRKARYQVDD